MGVDVIEAGFPVSSPMEFEAVAAVAAAVERPIIAGLARATNTDVDKAAGALADAARPRVHVFLATSDLHLERKLKIDRDEALRRIERAVARAREASRTSNSAARTRPARIWTFCAAPSRRRSRRVPRRSIFPTRSGTPTRPISNGCFRRSRPVALVSMGSCFRSTVTTTWASPWPLALRHRERRPAGRVHGQRDRRTSGECVARGARHVPEGAAPATRTSSKPES